MGKEFPPDIDIETVWDGLLNSSCICLILYFNMKVGLDIERRKQVKKLWRRNSVWSRVSRSVSSTFLWIAVCNNIKSSIRRIPLQIWFRRQPVVDLHAILSRFHLDWYSAAAKYYNSIHAYAWCSYHLNVSVSVFLILIFLPVSIQQVAFCNFGCSDHRFSPANVRCAAVG